MLHFLLGFYKRARCFKDFRMVTCNYQNNKKGDAFERITIARQSLPH